MVAELETELEEEIVPVKKRLLKDILASGKLPSKQEQRFIVDTFYQLQSDRIVKANQVRSIEKGIPGEPHAVLDYIFQESKSLELRIKNILGELSDTTLTGRWTKSLTGFGPIIATALDAFLDIEKAPTCAHIWSYGGFNPEMKWEKGKKRPWDARVKVIFYKVGENIIMFKNRGCFYGPIFDKMKLDETAKNEAGLFVEQAKAVVAAGRIKSPDQLAYYKAGTLSPGHIHARARRKIIKLFLSHWHHVAYYDRYKMLPPAPYAMRELGHEDYIQPPNLEDFSIPRFDNNDIQKVAEIARNKLLLKQNQSLV